MTNYYQNDLEVLSQKQHDTLGHLHDGLQGKARINFIKKVYSILSCQLLITFAFCFIAYNVPEFLRFQIENQGLMWVALGLIIATEIALLCFDLGRRFPINLILLLIFTLCQSYLVSFICSSVGQNQGGEIVLIAALLTLSMFLSLTAYAIFTKRDFSVKLGILNVVLTTLIILSFISIFSRSPYLNNLICGFGVIVFGIYIVIDTQLIVGGRRYKLELDDYILGALILYIDLIQIFLYILRLLSKNK